MRAIIPAALIGALAFTSVVVNIPEAFATTMSETSFTSNGPQCNDPINHPDCKKKSPSKKKPGKGKKPGKKRPPPPR